MTFKGVVFDHEVDSDKDLKSIDGSLVTFTDGSWYDVATGQSSNKGPGYINVNSPESAEKPKLVTITKSFNAKSLAVPNLATDLIIKVHDKQTIDVELVGTQKSVDAYELSESDGVLTLKGGDSPEGINVSIGNVSFVNISGNSISFNSIGGVGLGKPRTTVTVSVPKGTPLDISHVRGDTTIGDTEGTLNFEVSERGSATIGRIGNTNLGIKGSGDIDIENVTGFLSATISGRGSIDVSKGNVTDLNVDIDASGDFEFGGKATNSKIEISGRGSVDVHEVNGNLTMIVSGSGDIDVNGGEVSTLNITISGRGDADFGGRAVDARLTVTGSGDIDVHYVKNEPIQKIKGRGDITVGNWDD